MARLFPALVAGLAVAAFSPLALAVNGENAHIESAQHKTKTPKKPNKHVAKSPAVPPAQPTVRTGPAADTGAAAEPNGSAGASRKQSPKNPAPQKGGVESGHYRINSQNSR